MKADARCGGSGRLIGVRWADERVLAMRPSAAGDSS